MEVKTVLNVKRNVLISIILKRMSSKDKRAYIKTGKYSAEAKEERRNLRESKKLLRAMEAEKRRRERAEQLAKKRGVQ